MKVYVVQSSRGEYDDYVESIEGIFSTREAAEQLAKEIAESYLVDESKLPMTFDEYQKCNWGYRDEDEEPADFDKWPKEKQDEFYEEIVPKNGHTVEDFKVMEDAQNIQYERFNCCRVEPYELDSTDNPKALEQTKWFHKDGRIDTFK